LIKKKLHIVMVLIIVIHKIGAIYAGNKL